MALHDLITRHAPGFSLERDFYAMPEIFDRDMDLLLDRWSCAGHGGDLPKTGDYLLTALGRESAIVARQKNGGLRAFANVCRHRGSQICTRPHGRSVIFTCPYHAWTYNLDGTLRQAREMPPGFDPAAHNLIELPTRVVGGLIFVSFGQHPPAIDAAASALAVMTSRHGWETARVAQRRTYRVQANWKLALENYHECYHCGPAHPEFSDLHALAQPGHRKIAADDVESWAPGADGAEVFRVMGSSLTEGAQTGSRDGRALARRMGNAPFGACAFAELGFLSAFLAYADYGVIYRFMPKDVLDTEMEVLWLVRGDAEEGRDYDPAALTWLWDVTSLADKAIIERNQAGVLSRFYRPGPFSLMEPGTRQYVDRYVGELAARGAAEAV